MILFFLSTTIVIFRPYWQISMYVVIYSIFCIFKNPSGFTWILGQNSDGAFLQILCVTLLVSGWTQCLFGNGRFWFRARPERFCNRRHSAAIPRIAKKRKRSSGPKDAFSGWTLIWENKMNGLFLRWLILTIAILITSYLMDGIQVAGFFSAFFAAAILGILNAFFRPVLLIITLPLNVLSLGLFTFVINAVLLMMVSGVIPGFKVAGFWSAVFGSLFISLISWFITSFINERGTFEYIELKRRGNNRWE